MAPIVIYQYCTIKLADKYCSLDDKDKDSSSLISSSSASSLASSIPPKDLSAFLATKDEDKSTSSPIPSKDVHPSPIGIPYIPDKDKTTTPIMMPFSSSLPVKDRDENSPTSSTDKPTSVSDKDKDKPSAKDESSTPLISKDDKPSSLPDKDKDKSTIKSEPTTTASSKDDKPSSLPDKNNDKTTIPTSTNDKTSSLLDEDKAKHKTMAPLLSYEKLSSLPNNDKSSSIASNSKDDKGSNTPNKDQPSSLAVTQGIPVRLTLSLDKPTSSSLAGVTTSEAEVGPPVIIYSLTLPSETPSATVTSTISGKPEGSSLGTATFPSTAPIFSSKPETPNSRIGEPSKTVSVFQIMPSLTISSTPEITSFPGYQIVPSPTEESSPSEKGAYTNATSSVIPVWTPGNLGHGYGGGFIITPSIYVTKLPFPNGPSEGVPPGYDTSSVPELSMSISNSSLPSVSKDKDSKSSLPTSLSSALSFPSLSGDKGKPEHTNLPSSVRGSIQSFSRPISLDTIPSLGPYKKYSQTPTGSTGHVSESAMSKTLSESGTGTILVSISKVPTSDKSSSFEVTLLTTEIPSSTTKDRGSVSAVSGAIKFSISDSAALSTLIHSGKPIVQTSINKPTASTPMSAVVTQQSNKPEQTTSKIELSSLTSASQGLSLMGSLPVFKGSSIDISGTKDIVNGGSIVSPSPTILTTSSSALATNPSSIPIAITLSPSSSKLDMAPPAAKSDSEAISSAATIKVEPSSKLVAGTSSPNAVTKPESAPATDSSGVSSASAAITGPPLSTASQPIESSPSALTNLGETGAPSELGKFSTETSNPLVSESKDIASTAVVPGDSTNANGKAFESPNTSAGSTMTTKDMKTASGGSAAPASTTPGAAVVPYSKLEELFSNFDLVGSQTTPTQASPGTGHKTESETVGASSTTVAEGIEVPTTLPSGSPVLSGHRGLPMFPTIQPLPSKDQETGSETTATSANGGLAVPTTMVSESDVVSEHGGPPTPKSSISILGGLDSQPTAQATPPALTALSPSTVGGSALLGSSPDSSGVSSPPKGAAGGLIEASTEAAGVSTSATATSPAVLAGSTDTKGETAPPIAGKPESTGSETGALSTSLTIKGEETTTLSHKEETLPSSSGKPETKGPQTGGAPGSSVSSSSQQSSGAKTSGAQDTSVTQAKDESSSSQGGISTTIALGHGQLPSASVPVAVSQSSVAEDSGGQSTKTGEAKPTTKSSQLGKQESTDLGNGSPSMSNMMVGGSSSSTLEAAGEQTTTSSQGNSAKSTYVAGAPGEASIPVSSPGAESLAPNKAATSSVGTGALSLPGVMGGGVGPSAPLSFITSLGTQSLPSSGISGTGLGGVSGNSSISMLTSPTSLPTFEGVAAHLTMSIGAGLVGAFALLFLL